MKTVSGYKLNVVFDTKRELTNEESEELCEKILELLDFSEVVALKLTPITEEE